MKNENLPLIVSAAGVYRSRLVYKNDGVSNARTARLFELELPLESTGVSYIDGKAYPVERNTVVVAKPGQVRYSKLPYFCSYLHLRVPDAYFSSCLSALPQRIPVSDPADFARRFERIAALGEEDALVAISCILELILALQTEAQNAPLPTRRGKADAVQAAIDYIRADLTRDLRLPAVAEAVFLSPTYLHAVFARRTGLTLRAYVEELRIRRAMELLSQTTLTLTEIAARCGFGSQSYFSYVFKKCRGVSPREYARQLSERYPLRLIE